MFRKVKKRFTDELLNPMLGFKMDARLRPYFPFASLKSEHGLLNKHPVTTLVTAPVVCWTSPYKDDVERRYGVFTSVRALCSFYERIPPADRTGYEVIIGEFPQKPHFDIDIATVDVSGDLVVEHLIDVVVDTLAQKGVVITPARDVLIYTSHGRDKQSYHVVLPNHRHANHVHAKAFAAHVRAAMPLEVRTYVDMGVYNPLQLFRLLGSTKVGKGRPKVECTEWFYHGERLCPPAASPLEAFARSLVGWTETCVPLPSWDVPEPSFVPKRMMSVDAEETLHLLSLDPVLGECRFRPRVAGSVIALQRVSPGFCPLCSRTHEHDNAYLVVREKNVYYKCHRARAEGLRGSHFLGTLPTPS